VAQVRDDQHFLFRLAFQERFNYLNLAIIKIGIHVTGGLGVSILGGVFGVRRGRLFAQAGQLVTLARGEHKAKGMRLVGGMLPPERSVVQDIYQVMPLAGALDRADKIGDKAQRATLFDSPIHKSLEVLAHEHQLTL